MVCFGFSLLCIAFLPWVAHVAIKASYYEWGIVNLIEKYAVDHDGLAPKSWAALQPYYKSSGHLGGSKSLEDLKTLIVIDFDCLENLSRGITLERARPCISRTPFTLRFTWIDAEAELRWFFKNFESAKQRVFMD